jgi:hypothetical protein
VEFWIQSPVRTRTLDRNLYAVSLWWQLLVEIEIITKKEIWYQLKWCTVNLVEGKTDTATSYNKPNIKSAKFDPRKIDQCKNIQHVIKLPVDKAVYYKICCGLKMTQKLNFLGKQKIIESH